jgi:outer membrane protein OmpA-like peptidoglycan-associated protein
MKNLLQVLTFCIFVVLVQCTHVQQNESDTNLKKNIDRSRLFSYTSSDSIELSEEMEIYLDQCALYLKDNPNYRIAITGHSDIMGSIEEEFQTATDRANNAKEYLKEIGIEEKRILAIGIGFVNPIEGKNNILEIKIIPNSKENR